MIVTLWASLLVFLIYLTCLVIRHLPRLWTHQTRTAELRALQDTLMKFKVDIEVRESALLSARDDIEALQGERQRLVQALCDAEIDLGPSGDDQEVRLYY